MGISKDLYFSDTGFAFDPSTGITYSMNQSGAFILRKLREGVGIPDIVRALVSEFEIDPRKAGEDVRDFVQQLADLDLD